MCELFAMSSREPATVNLSFPEFARHGGETGHHVDGWGIGFYEGPRLQLLCEARPAANSALARFVGTHDGESRLVVSHIRKATRGAVNLSNTQPFQRSLGGRDHIFAHNGDIDGLDGHPALCHGFHRPVGDTDSERAFCALLARLEPIWASGPPTVDARVAVVAAFATALTPLGIANFLYADGELLFALGHKRTQAGTGRVEPPGLHMMHRECEQPHSVGGGGGVTIETEARHQEVVLFASVPLTREPGWRALAEGELVVVRDGVVLHRVQTGR